MRKDLEYCKNGQFKLKTGRPVLRMGIAGRRGKRLSGKDCLCQ